VLVGAEFGKGFLAEAEYTLIPKFDEAEVGGYQLRLGCRF